MAGTVISLLTRGGRAQQKAPAKPLPKGPTEMEALRQALELALGAMRAEAQARLETVQADLAQARQERASALEELAGAQGRGEALQAKLGQALATATGLRVELGNEQERCAELEARCAAAERVSNDRHAALMAAIAAIKPARLVATPAPGKVPPPPSYQLIPKGRDLNGRATGYDLIPVKEGK